MKLLVDIVNIRIVEELREKMGGIYSGGMNGVFDKEPYGMFSLSMFLPCGPKSVDTLIGATHALLERLKQEGPTAKDLEKVKRARIESNRESMKNNYYWLNKLSELSLYPESTAGILDFEARINAISEADVQAAAKLLLTGENVFRAVLYPEK
jgi:zinc protease